MSEQERDFSADGRKTINIWLDDHLLLLLGNCVSQLLSPPLQTKQKISRAHSIGSEVEQLRNLKPKIDSRAREKVSVAKIIRARSIQQEFICKTELCPAEQWCVGENSRTWQNSTLFRAHQHNVMARKECSNWTEIIEKRIFPSQTLSNSIRGSLNSYLGEKLTILLL